MSLRQVRFLMWLGTIAVGALTVTSIIWAARPPVIGLADQGQPKSDSHNSSKTSPAEISVTSKDLQQVAQVNLRRALEDAPLPVAIIPQAPPPLDIRLVGTIFEPNHCEAMIQLGDGTVELKAVGDVTGNARILNIRNGSIDVEYADHSETLSVPKKGNN